MRFATPARSEWEEWGESTAAIVAMGLALAIAGTVRSLATPVAEPVVAFELFVSLLVPTGLATGGYWLASRDVSPDVRWRAAIRVSIGIVAACAFGVWLAAYVPLEGGSIRDPFSLTTTLTAVGGATGFVTAVREPLDGPSGSAIGASALPRADAVGPTPELEAAPSAERSRPPERSRLPEGSTAEADAATARSADSASTAASAQRPAEAAATGASTAVWSDADRSGRTAAPASPVDPVDREEFADAVDPRDPLESPTPARDPGVDAVAAVPSTAETVLGVLRDERARLALAVCYHEWDGEERSVDALARAVSAHTDEDADAVAADLRHATLPRLREIRAVEWEPCTDRVSAPDHAVFEEGVREASVLLESFEPGTR